MLVPVTSRGVVLPMAVTASAVLLLSSLSLQTLALQARQRGRHPWHRAVGRDAAQSAAMDFARRSRGPQACLLQWSSDRWLDPQICPQADVAALRSGAADQLHWTLERWQPASQTAALRLTQPRGGSLSVVAEFSAAGVQIMQVHG